MAAKSGTPRKRLTPEQKQEIINSKGKVPGADLAKKHDVSLATIYNTWKKAKKKIKKAPASKNKTRKSTNPNQNRIDFCKRWITLLQAEVKRLESEPDLLKQAETTLAKIIGQQQKS